MTSIKTVTDSQIQTLRSEAAVAGDFKQVSICDRALNGSARAIRACVAAIRDNEAQS